MAKLIYSVISSLDGYVADENGGFDWAAPDEELHTFVNDMERPIGTYLLGRKMYDLMAVWETMDLAPEPDCIKDFAQMWRAADKIVYSTSLKSVDTRQTRIERKFEAAAIRDMKAGAKRDISIAGPNLAAQAMQAGLIDEWNFYLVPVVVGKGKRALPESVRLNLELIGHHRFAAGAVHLQYRTAAD
ncbi:MAG: dihydrofolate reductase family protein [Actinomycetota bacterium]